MYIVHCTLIRAIYVHCTCESLNTFFASSIRFYVRCFQMFFLLFLMIIVHFQYKYFRFKYNKFVTSKKKIIRNINIRLFSFLGSRHNYISYRDKWSPVVPVLFFLLSMHDTLNCYESRYDFTKWLSISHFTGEI